MALKLVWQPGRIGPVQIPNRIMRTANTTSMFPNALNEDFLAYHVARARGGVGLTILEAGSVHPNSQIAYLVDDAAVPFYRKMMDAIRPYGMRVFQQLWHGGHNLPGAGGVMPWSCSATPSPLTGIVGVPMGQPEIDEVIAAFAAAAQRCRDGGLDGVEIHGGHGYLVQQFLSALTNRRSDGYNGDLLQRTRFLVEVLEAVRAAVGTGFPVGVRLSPSTATGGTSAEDLNQVARHLVQLGLIDFLDISYADYFFMEGMSHTMAFPSAYEVPTSSIVGRDIAVPRMVTGRFRSIDDAEQVLREGAADYVSMVRAHIADPDIVRKTRAGQVEDIRPCIACNQGCVGGLLTIGKMRCAVNPAAGYESTLDESLIVRASRPKTVMVVGGGPAGLEAARVAALAGHRVILAEAAHRLGGALLTASRAPHLHILGDLIGWFERQVHALGVEVRFNTYVEADDVRQEAPDVLFVATGSQYTRDGRQALMPGEPPPGMDLPHVYNPASCLSAPAQPLQGRQALVFDDVGRYEAIAAAEHLARQGAAVTFVTSLGAFAPKMLGTSRDIESFKRLSRGAFTVRVHHNVLAIEPGWVTVRAAGSPTPERLPADVVAMGTYPEPVRTLFDELRGSVPDVRLIGDALSPRDLLAATADGHRSARTL